MLTLMNILGLSCCKCLYKSFKKEWGWYFCLHGNIFNFFFSVKPKLENKCSEEKVVYILTNSTNPLTVLMLISRQLYFN